MSERSGIRVLSVDDHPLLREGLAAVIDSQPDMFWTECAPATWVAPAPGLAIVKHLARAHGGEV